MDNEDKDVLDPTELTLDDFKKMELDDLLIHIKERGSHKTEITIICMFKVIKQLINETETELETPIVKFRQRFRKESDLERRLDLIHGFIEYNKLTTHNHSNHTNLPNQTTEKSPLDKQFEELEKALERMKYTDYNQIKDLKTKNKKLAYDQNKEDYNKKKERLRSLLNSICKIYRPTIAERYKQEVSHQYFMEGFEKILETKDTAETTSFVTTAQEEAMLTYAEGSNQLSTEQANQLRQSIYRRSAQEFYEKQDRIKEKEKERDLKKQVSNHKN